LRDIESKAAAYEVVWDYDGYKPNQTAVIRYDGSGGHLERG
jgi:hypothetical protein